MQAELGSLVCECASLALTDVSAGASAQSALESSAPVSPVSNTATSGRRSGTSRPSMSKRVALTCLRSKGERQEPFRAHGLTLNPKEGVRAFGAQGGSMLFWVRGVCCVALYCVVVHRVAP